MAGPLGFKDMMTVDYRPGEDELTKYRAHKRRRGQGAGSDAEYASTNPPRQETDEALTMAQRLKKSRNMKKYKARLAVGRKRAASRMADKKRLEKRARKAARAFLAKKLTKGISKTELTPARKQEIEKRLDKMKAMTTRVAKRMLPKIRKAAMARKRG